MNFGITSPPSVRFYGAGLLLFLGAALMLLSSNDQSYLRRRSRRSLQGDDMDIDSGFGVPSPPDLSDVSVSMPDVSRPDVSMPDASTMDMPTPDFDFSQLVLTNPFDSDFVPPGTDGDDDDDDDG